MVTVAIARHSGCTSPVAEATPANTCDFTVTIAGGTRASGVSLELPFTVGGTGITTADYSITAPTGITGSGGMLTFAQADTTETITLTITDDDLNEAQETLTITGAAAGASGLRLTGTGAGPVEYTSGGNTASVMVTDNDAITVTLARDSATATEGGSAEFTVTLDHASTAQVVVPYTIGDGSGDDAPSPAVGATGTVEFPLGANGQTATTMTLSLPIPRTDALGDGDMRNLQVTLGATASEYMAAGTIMRTTTAGMHTADVTVSYRTAVRTLTVTGPATVTEGTAGTFNIGITGTPFRTPAAVPVTWTITPTGSADADDFGGMAGLTGMVTFPTQTSFTITPVNNDLVESGKSFTVQLSVEDNSLDDGTAFGDPATVSIDEDDEAGLTISPSPLEVPEGGEAQYTVRLATQPTMGTVTVTVSGGGSTVTFAPTTALTFTSTNWNTPQTVTVTAAMDAEIDDTATLAHEVTGSGEYAGITEVNLAVTIVKPAGEAATHELLLPEVTRAVVGQQMDAIAGRVGNIFGGGVGDSASFRQRGSSLAGAAAALAQSAADADGVVDVDAITTADARKLLHGLAFATPVLGAGHGGEHDPNLGFWGGAEYRDFGGKDGDDEWDGSAFGLHFGADGQVLDNLRAGLMLSYSDSETEYTRSVDGAEVKGDYDLEVTSVSPYLAWRLGDGSAWASVTYGSGEVEDKPDDGEAGVNDVTVSGVAAGGSRKLLSQGGRELSVRGDVFTAESEVDGDGDGDRAGLDEDLEVDTERVRVALAWSYPGRFAAGRLAPAFDLGLRHDGGDGSSGGGLELGGELKFRDQARGLTLIGNARALLGHSGDQRGWGLGGLVRVQNGVDGQGLALTVAPGYGDELAGVGDALGESALWNGLRQGQKPADLHARLDAEVGYGIPTAGLGDSRFGRAVGGVFGVDSVGMVTPYSSLRVGNSAHDYRLGMRWTPARHIDLDLFARHRNATTTDNAIAIEGKLRF